jgi:uracil-DNA glycosylase
VPTFDKGPSIPVFDHFASLPSYEARKSLFWYDWGPIFYRGRLDRSARLLCIASDPGPTERVAGRTLVGDAGQRVQGFLSKLGLTRSYLCINAFAYALFPSAAGSATAMLHEEPHVTWRNTLIALTTGPQLQAVVAFGVQAQAAVADWDNPRGLPVVPLPHPSSRSATVLASEWRDGITRLRGLVTPDSDGDATGPNYGTSIKEADYTAIPRGDLPFGVPEFLGDDAWGRSASPRHNNGVERPQTDFKHSLLWQAPTGS